MKSPLALFVLWHPSFHEGTAYANLIFSEFRRNVSDPMSRGMNIPVYFRYVDPLLPIPEGDYQFTVVIALIESNFILDEAYTEFLSSIHARQSPGTLIIPVALERNALSMNLGKLNFARLYERENKEEYLIGIVAHETVRHLYHLPDVSEMKITGPPPPLKLFISHAKADGLEIATQIKTYVEKSLPLKTFFDANDISIGYDFSEEIERYIKDAVIVAVHTDMYSSREWCRREILLAKENNRPIVVLNCFLNGESRSFPYMANVLTVHYQSLDNNSYKDSPVWSRLITAVLKETLRLRYQEMWIAFVMWVNKRKVKVKSISAYPPELVTVLKKRRVLNKEFLYPDPPLGKEELSILQSFDNQISYLTPSEL
jgi:hypothetical protein